VSPAFVRSILAALFVAACGSQPAPRAIAPTPLVADPVVAIVGTETRHVGLLQPSEPAGLRFGISVPVDPVLTFGFGLPEGEIAVVRTPATFEFSIETELQGRTVIGGRRVDPAILEDRRWFDARVDLSAWSGEEAVLGFRVVPDEGKPAPIGAIANPTLLSAGHRDDRPNVLIVSLDTLRASSVGAYGYARDTTPFLDGFAARGTLFETAITTSVTTGPSHMSLFTGLYPVNHGMRAGNEAKTDGVVTLATHLRGAGYDTAAFTENGFIIRKLGFGQGFDKYTENRGSRLRAPGEARVTFPQVERWIAQRAREPFFAFVHTYEVHSPFQPPESYSDLFADDGLPGPELSAIRLQRDNYDREIRFADDELRRLVTTLEERGLLERTLVVILSDHGEEFHEHGRYQHGGAVFDETLRIPLIFVGPGVKGGQRIETQVSLIDVLPTVLDFVGVDASEDTDGSSLIPALREGTEPAARTLFAEANAPKRWVRPFLGESWNPPLIAVRSQEEKLIFHRPRKGEADPPERYDLGADALERSPLPIEGDALVAAEALVDAYLKGREEPGIAQPTEPLDDDLRRRLELLGYLDVGEDAAQSP
jgi:arylsulfatase A-like enzyme